MRTCVTILFAVLFAGFASGQIVFDTVYQASLTDRAFDVVNGPDGSFVIAGWTNNSSNPGGGDILVMKIDSTGVKQWEKAYGTMDFDVGYGITICKSGGYAVCGSVFTGASMFNNFYLLRIDEDGNKMWDRQYGGIIQDNPRSVVEMSDGGFLLIGSSASFNQLSWDGWVVRTDSVGDTLWTRFFVGTGEDYLDDGVETWDGGALIVGGFDLHPGFHWVIRLDSSGDTLWTRKFTIPNPFNQNHSMAVLALPDTTYIITGTGTSRINDKGEVLWKNSNWGGVDLAKAGHKHFLMAAGNFLSKFDHEGNQIWIEFIPDGDFLTVVQASDGGYLLAGDYDNPNTTNLEIRVTKVNCLGRLEIDSACSPPDPIVPSPPFQIDVFPIPARNFISIRLTSAIEERDYSFELMDMAGRKVFTGKLIEGENQISALGFRQGVYWYRIKENKTPLQVGKIILTH